MNNTALISIINQSTNSVNQMRNVMFLPYDNIYQTNIYKEFKANDRKISIFENSRYRLEITDFLLSQKHRDILDIVFSTAKIKPLEGDRAYVDFTINSILSELGLSDGTENRNTIIKYLEELKRVNIKLIIKDGLFKDNLFFNLCDISAHSEKLNKYVLVFNEMYLYMFQKDILVNYNFYLPQILKLESATLKALIRYIISNDWINHQLEDLLSEIEIKKETMTTRNFNKTKKIIKDNIEILSSFGICLNPTTEQITYKKLEKIIFYNTKKEILKYEQKEINFEN